MAKVTVIKEKNYTTIDNGIFKDTRISFKAKGLLTTMLSLPPTWNYTIEGLSRLAKDGRDSIKTALKELENFGYLERKQIRNDNGSFCDLEYFVYEKPQPKEPLAENPSTDKSSTENPSQLSTYKLNTYKSNKDKLNTKDKDNTLSGERADRACAETGSKGTTNKENRKKESRDLFERLWSLYPLKKGKGSVSDTQKARLLDIGYEELERAISRYKQYVESVDYLHYKNGSTFFNSGYIDYLDENVEDGIGNSEEFEAYRSEQELGESKDPKKESRKERIEQAKRKAIREYELEEGYWDGMDDAEAESFLGLFGISLGDA